jgi:hypothetical protein
MKHDLESTSLDARLQAEDQQRVRQTVRALAEEVPSMAWRSALNERIYAEANKRRSRQRLWWIFTPSIGVAVAGALALVVFFKVPTRTARPELPPAVMASSLEDSLVGIAADNAISDDVTGSGLHVRDLPTDTGAKTTNAAPADGSTDSEEDVPDL